MIPCLPDHEEEAECPECGQSHKEYGKIPKEPIFFDEVYDIFELDSIDCVIPIFEVEVKDEFGEKRELVPAIAIREGETCRIVWNNPSREEDKWINAIVVESAEDPSVTVRAMAGDVAVNAQEAEVVAGFKVIENEIKEHV